MTRQSLPSFLRIWQAFSAWSSVSPTILALKSFFPFFSVNGLTFKVPPRATGPSSSSLLLASERAAFGELKAPNWLA